MEWEKKFYDIVRETESNLENARRKLQGCGGGKNTSTLTNQSINLFPLTESNSLVATNNNSKEVSSLHHQLGWSVVPASPRMNPMTSRLSPSAALLPSISTGGYRDLQSKIDSQNMVIERLERLVRTLSQEKDHYRRQILDLQSEVGNISSQLSKSRLGIGSDIHLETQVDLMRHEAHSDMQRLQQLLSSTRSAALQSGSLERSFYDMQHNVHSELEELRRDLINMMHRVGKLELGVSVHTASQRDLRNHLNISYPSASQSSILGTRNSNHSFAKEGDISQIKDLRSTVSQLHDKLDCLERRLTASYSLPSALPANATSVPLSGHRKLPSKLFKSAPKVSFNDFNMDDDDVDADEDNDNDNSDLDDRDLSDDLDLGLDHSDEDLSDDLEEIVNSGKINSSKLTSRLHSSSLQELLAAERYQPDDEKLLSNSNDSSEGLISDLELENLDLESGSLEIESLDESADLQPDDL